MRLLWWPPILAGTIIVGAIVLAVKGQLDERSDDRLFERIGTDQTLDLAPPESVALERWATGPCEGDSATGPLVTISLSSDLAPREILDYYRAELGRLGWEGLSATAFDLEGWREDDGYRMSVSVFYQQWEDTDFSVTISADPRQNCLLPIL